MDDGLGMDDHAKLFRRQGKQEMGSSINSSPLFIKVALSEAGSCVPSPSWDGVIVFFHRRCFHAWLQAPFAERLARRR